MMWLVLIFVPTLLYGSLIFWFYYGWRKLAPFELTQNTLNQFVTIVVAARNEADTLPYLLNDLNQQTYPKNNFEIIFVDDHSSDNTLKILNEAKVQMNNLNIISLSDAFQGKKQALKQAIKSAKGELIITTDADCRVGARWVESIESFFSINHTDFLIGPVVYHNEKGIFENMQSIEILSMVASGAGAASISFPILCNGANLAFTRKLYNHSYQEMITENPSGDDIFLLQAAKKIKNCRIHFIKSFDALVETEPTKSISEFLSQRKRWTSKSRYYKDKSIIISAIIVFGMSFLLCCLFILSFIWPKLFFVYFVILLLKSVFDWPLLFSFTGFFKKRYVLKYFVITQLIYPFYIVFMTVYGNTKKFEWKSRLYQ